MKEPKENYSDELAYKAIDKKFENKNPLLKEKPRVFIESNPVVDTWYNPKSVKKGKRV